MHLKKYPGSTFFVAMALCSTTALAAIPQQQVMAKNGHTVRIDAVSALAHNVYLDNRLMYHDTTDMMVFPGGSYSIGGTTYFLISDESGGMACPSSYRVIIAGARDVVTSSFGTCSDTPSVSASGSKLLVTLPKMNGNGKVVYAIDSAGAITTSAVAKQYIGSGYHNGQDLAGLVLGKQSYTAFQLKSTAQKLESILGTSEFKTLSGYTIGGNFTKVGNFAVGSVCEPNLCGMTETALVFDGHGGAWVRTLSNGMTRWFGNPSAAVVSAGATIR